MTADGLERPLPEASVADVMRAIGLAAASSAASGVLVPRNSATAPLSMPGAAAGDMSQTPASEITSVTATSPATQSAS